MLLSTLGTTILPAIIMVILKIIHGVEAMTPMEEMLMLLGPVKGCGKAEEREEKVRVKGKENYASIADNPDILLLIVPLKGRVRGNMATKGEKVRENPVTKEARERGSTMFMFRNSRSSGQLIGLRSLMERVICVDSGDIPLSTALRTQMP